MIGRSAQPAPSVRLLSRQRIVALALHIIDEHGLEALNIRRLAAEAGVKPMSLYHHFRSKTAILDAVGESIAAGGARSVRAGPSLAGARAPALHGSACAGGGASAGVAADLDRRRCARRVGVAGWRSSCGTLLGAGLQRRPRRL